MPKIVDVSHYHPVVDVAALQGAGLAGLIGKVSEGAAGGDATWIANRDLARRAGLHVGGYHFWRYAASPQANVDAFMRHVGDLSLLTIRAALDCEDPAAPKDRHAVGDHIGSTIELLKRALGYDPMIYTGNWWWSPWVQDAGAFAAALPIWLSGYTAHEPTATGPWNRLPDLWQETSSASVPGVAGAADLSECDDAGLARLTIGGQPSPVTYTPGDDMSAEDVAAINAHTDEAANGVIAFLSKELQGDPANTAAPGLSAMVASMHHGGYGEDGGVQGNLAFLDRHIEVKVTEALAAAGVTKPTSSG